MPIRLADPSVTIEPCSDGTLYRGPELGSVSRCAGEWLLHWAQVAPDRIWLAERAPGGQWRTLTYSDGHRRVCGLASAVLASAGDRPVLLLSDNSIAHALLQLAAMHIGLPAAPLSPAYSLLSTDFVRLRQIAELLQPAIVFAEDPARVLAALDALQAACVWSAADIERLVESTPSPESEARAARVGPETAAKILFTSGSTGSPKGVVNTQRMICSNQAAIAAAWPFVEDSPPVAVDWLPWSHTFGGNHNFFLILRNGGTLYIDAGRPAPGLFARSLDNLRDVSPTVYFNVPRGLDLLASALEQDEALMRAFFSRLDLLFYAAAALPATTRARLIGLAARAGRGDLFFGAAWGMTETAPMSTLVHFPTDSPASIGAPAPGVAIKLAEVDGKREIRVSGPNVTPGYWTPQGIIPPDRDADGFLRTGDAVRLDDPAHPERGFVFEGRLGENFKLTSGTWVRVGPLRLAIIEATAPLVIDAVIAGHGRDELGVMLFVSPAASADDLLAQIRARLAAYNAVHTASSEHIRRALILSRPASLDAGETTDKGYLNQRRLLETRADDVLRLFADPPPEGVLVL